MKTALTCFNCGVRYFWGTNNVVNAETVSLTQENTTSPQHVREVPLYFLKKWNSCSFLFFVSKKCNEQFLYTQYLQWSVVLLCKRVE